MAKPEFDESMLYGDNLPVENQPPITAELQHSDPMTDVHVADTNGVQYRGQKDDE